MTIFKGPYKVFTHGNINENYFNANNLGFVTFGHLEYSNVVVPNHIMENPYAYINNDEIYTSASVKFPSGETLEKVYVYVKINTDGIIVLPIVISLWNQLKQSSYTDLVTRLKSDAKVNRSFYSRVKSDHLFCNILSGLGIEKSISMHQLFDDQMARSFYLWKYRIGFINNETGAKFDVAGRKAVNELIKEYIETEKVYRTDPIRDKIDDALHLMNVNGDKLMRQLWYFNNRI
jgi:hypothetical protein